MNEMKILNLGSIIKSFFILMWEALAIRSVNAIFTHPDLSCIPRNVFMTDEYKRSFKLNNMVELEKTLANAIERLEKLRLYNVSHNSSQVTESIFSGKSFIIPMADVQHIERHWYGDGERTKDNYKGIMVITKHIKWSQEIDTWENNIYLDREEADNFISAWCMYRHELEKSTLMEMP